MPRIPSYNSEGSIQTRSLAAEAPAVRISADSFTGPEKALGQAGEAISAIAQDIHKVRQD